MINSPAGKQQATMATHHHIHKATTNRHRQANKATATHLRRECIISRDNHHRGATMATRGAGVVLVGGL